MHLILDTVKLSKVTFLSLTALFSMIFYLLPLNFMMIKRMQFEIFLLEVPNSWLEIRI